MQIIENLKKDNLEMASLIKDLEKTLNDTSVSKNFLSNNIFKNLKFYI